MKRPTHRDDTARNGSSIRCPTSRSRGLEQPTPPQTTRMPHRPDCGHRARFASVTRSRRGARRGFRFGRPSGGTLDLPTLEPPRDCPKSPRGGRWALGIEQAPAPRSRCRPGRGGPVAVIEEELDARCHGEALPHASAQINPIEGMTPSRSRSRRGAKTGCVSSLAGRSPEHERSGPDDAVFCCARRRDVDGCRE